MREELKRGLELAKTLDPAELPELIGALAQINAVATARLTTPAVTAKPDELLDIEETARRMGVSRDYLYRAHRRLSFTRRQGRKLLFSSSGLDNYLKRARA
jgi:excisionase family DNA binding protein